MSPQRAGRPGDTVGVGMLEFIHKAATLVGALQTWFLGQPLPIQVMVGAVGLAVLWVAWILLRVTLAAFRGAFRGL
jgi:hypothetical protein